MNRMTNVDDAMILNIQYALSYNLNCDSCNLSQTHNLSGGQENVETKITEQHRNMY